MGQCIARNGGNDDLTAVGDDHGIGLQVGDLVGGNLVSQLDLHRAPADLVAQPPQERFVLGCRIDAHNSAPPVWLLRSNIVT